MNELLSALLTDKDYKDLFTYNLLLGKSSPDNFEHYVLDLLDDIFGFNHTIYFTHSDSGYVENVISNNISKEFIEDYTNIFKNEDQINKFLYNYRYKINSQDVIVLSDIIESSEGKNTNYFNLLMKHSFCYDMYIVINDNGDGIRILRGNDKGKFTEKEKEIANYLSKILAPQNKNIIENRKSKDKIELFNKNIENMNFGFMMLSKEFELINYNKLAFCYSYDIAGTYDTNKIIEDFKKMIHEESDDNLSEGHNNSFHKSIKSFVVEIISTIVINKDNKVDTYYMIYIYNKIWFNRMLNKLNRTKEKYNLTNREKDIVSLVSKGLSNKEIAENLFISIYTVKEHMKNISKKMDVHSRTGIISKLAM